jgi:hypothetical protein
MMVTLVYSGKWLAKMFECKSMHREEEIVIAAKSSVLH